MADEQEHPAHLCGWLGSDDNQQLVAATMPKLVDAAPHLYGGAEDKPVLLYKAWTDVLGKAPDYAAQEIGDCVSFGHAHGNDLLQCIQIATGTWGDKYQATDTEFIYGTSRQVAGILGSGDGSYGSAAVKAMTTIGMVSRTMLGSEGTYSGQRAKQWGRSGVPDNIQKEAAPFKLGAGANVSTWADLVAAIQAGFPTTVCSDQGFTMTRDEQGFCSARGRWGHCVPPGTVIWGPTPRKAEDLGVGDVVFGHDGVAHQVVGAWARRYEGPMTTIALEGRPAVRFTSEHPVLIQRAVNPATMLDRLTSTQVVSPAGVRTAPPSRAVDKELWESAGSVRVGDRLLVPVRVHDEPVTEVEWVVTRPGVKTVLPAPIEASSDFAWLIGVYLAVGYTAAKRTWFLLPREDDAALETLTTVLREVVGVEPRVRHAGRRNVVTVASTVFAESFQAWCGGSAEPKRIPAFVLDWDLGALLDGIGVLQRDEWPDAGGKSRLFITSELLLNQLWALLAGEGRRPVIEPAPPVPHARRRDVGPWFITFQDDLDEKALTADGAYYAVPVTGVTSDPYDGLVYNWEVAVSNSYVADGVAVHNCMFIAAVRFDRPGALIVQSWGPNTPSGPCVMDQPNFSFWADQGVVERMLGAGDSWALSKSPAFDPVPLPQHWTNADWTG